MKVLKLVGQAELTQARNLSTTDFCSVLRLWVSWQASVLNLEVQMPALTGSVS